MIAGHPDGAIQKIEDTIRFAQDAGVRVMLSEFSPVPGTPDGERAGVDMVEPLNHNKTAYTIRALGWDEIARLKTLCREGNARLDSLFQGI